MFVYVMIYAVPQFRPDVPVVEVTPLAYAAQKGFTEIVKLLINFQADVNYLCSVRTTVFHL